MDNVNPKPNAENQTATRVPLGDYTGRVMQAAVVDSNALSARVAAMIGARLVPSPEMAPKSAPVVMIVSNQAAVDAAAHNVERLAAVIAWRLPESALVRLLELAVPCLIGEPTPEKLRAVLDGTDGGVDRAAERRAASRYTVLQRWLGQAPRRPDRSSPNGTNRAPGERPSAASAGGQPKSSR